MRRLLAILLLSVLHLWLVAPVLMADARPELPPCCRTHGKHKCALHMASLGREPVWGGAIASLTEKCPYCPAANGCSALSTFGVLRVARTLSTGMPAYPAQQPQTQARFRLSFNRTCQKRGPPPIS